MANQNTDKGRALEKAVRFIQETILSSDPKIKGTEFIIETNKRDNSSGVLHEIDVLVKTHPNSDYEATWVFECKNWAKPVDKNEVIVFAEKVEALRASRGFLVAKALSKEAESQLAQKSRLRFIRCTEDFLSPLNSAEIFHSVTDVLPMVVKIKERGVPCRQNPTTLDWRTIACHLNNEPVGLLSFIGPQIDEMIREDQKKHAALYRNDGTHWGETTRLIEFAKGEFVIGDMDVEYLTLPVQFFVTTRRKRILSKFELEGQGRAYSFEPIEDFQDGKQLEIHLVQRL